jgi:hypothetical protein
MVSLLKRPNQSRGPKLFTSALYLTCITGLALWFTLFISRYVPFDQDEVLQHHMLACLYYPLNWLNTGSGACNAWPLTIPGFSTSLPLRSYNYVGSIQSLLYLPFFLAWKHQHSARFFGIMMVAAQAFMLGRAYRVNPLAIFAICLAWLPYAYHHLVDIGHLTVQTTLVVAFQLLLLKLRASNSTKRDILLALALGITLGLGFYLRLSFAFLLPACGILLAATLIAKAISKGTVRGAFSWIITIGSLFTITWGILTAALLFARDQHGLRYYEMMTTQSSSDQATSLGLIWSHFSNRLSSFFFDPASASHICCGIAPSSAQIKELYLYSVAAFFLISLICAASWRARGWISLNLLGFVITSVIVSASSRSYGAHHVIPGFVFLVCAAVAGWGFTAKRFKIITRSAQVATLAVFVYANISAYRGLIETPRSTNGPYHLNLWRLFEVANERYAKTHVQVTTNWNALYNKSLYGPREQIVLGSESDRQNDFEWVKSVATKLNRDVVFISRAPDERQFAAMSAVFPDLKKIELPFDVGAWAIYEASAANKSGVIVER